jgi:hypothetical protein
VDDFSQALLAQLDDYFLRNDTAPRGPTPGLSVDEIITIVLVYMTRDANI